MVLQSFKPDRTQKLPSLQLGCLQIALNISAKEKILANTSSATKIQKAT